ncbi:hypothetical protein IEU95_03695 [Hoyosella rhizosphaerae]|uniref:Uncharacterized protein n=1 Tax=Hoyosella rhizosphaerae TaxID=1755582 RepID=A0A916XDY7_9ACTN|nr:hypothetical protein [Hoyosella rhizosphaerae]MBN4925919.1 hypothetical protein [Hoyosella rhizosphaerae]GGC66928.1 hypothetical protein GCM10011410_19470 [Hoyosella rhizosphaerae]
MAAERGAQSGALDPEFVSYADFGLAFFRRAISDERILGAVSSITGAPIEFGPIGAGPGRIAKVTAHGVVKDPVVTRLSDEEPLRFRLSIPVDLKFVVRLTGTVHRFRADVRADLRLTARAAEPLRVVVDVDPPSRGDVAVSVRAEGVASSVLQLVSGMESEVQRFVARYIREEITKPHIVAARDVDLGPLIDSAEI